MNDTHPMLVQEVEAFLDAHQAPLLAEKMTLALNEDEIRVFNVPRPNGVDYRVGFFWNEKSWCFRYGIKALVSTGASVQDRERAIEFGNPDSDDDTNLLMKLAAARMDGRRAVAVLPKRRGKQT